MAFFIEVPEGTYDITFTAHNTNIYHDYVIGCDLIKQDQYDPYTFYGVALPAGVYSDCGGIFIGAEGY